MNKIKTSIFAFVLSASSFFISTSSADVGYTNFSIGYVDGEYFARDAEGYDLRGSISVTDSIHLFAGYQSLDSSIVIPPFGTFDVDIDRLELGGGYHFELVDNLDFVTTFRVVDFDNGNGSSDGFQITGGIRGQLDNTIEYFADFVLEDLDDLDSDTGLSFGGRYYVTRFNSIGINFRDVNEFDTIRIDFRFDY